MSKGNSWLGWVDEQDRPKHEEYNPDALPGEPDYDPQAEIINAAIDSVFGQPSDWKRKDGYVHPKIADLARADMEKYGKK